MRFGVEFYDCKTKQDSHRTLHVVQAFLNYQLGERDYGPGLTSLRVVLLAGASPSRKLKRRRQYPNSFAEHLVYEVRADPGPPEKLSVDGFRLALMGVEEAVRESAAHWSGEVQLDALLADLHTVSEAAPASPAELQQLEQAAAGWNDVIELKILRAAEERRRRTPRALVRPLKGIRCYPSGRLENCLTPWDQLYASLFEGLLVAQHWCTPGYQEIYVNLDETVDQARGARSALEDWHENAYGVVNWDQYQAADRESRKELVFAAFCEALRELAEVDHLPREPLENAIGRIARDGFEQDLVFRSAANATHQARILYRLQESGAPRVYRLEVLELDSGRVKEYPLPLKTGEDGWEAYIFGRLQLTRREVRIHAQSNERARLLLRHSHRPALLSFPLN